VNQEVHLTDHDTLPGLACLPLEMQLMGPLTKMQRCLEVHLSRGWGLVYGQAPLAA
jgi:hypothetical protein